MFASVGSETAWEWAKKRRLWFKTPAKDVMGGAAVGLVGAVVRFGGGNVEWLRAALEGFVTTAVVSVTLPHLETLYWWWKRDSILLEERNAEVAALKATTAPPSQAVTWISDKPLAAPILVSDRTGWARLRITNKGAGAAFSATVQTYNFTAGAVEGRLVPAKWEEVEDPTQRIGRGDTRVLRLATLTNLGAPGVHGWKIHRADGPDFGGVDAEDVIDVTVVAEPDLAEPCQLRVVLRADPTKCELVRLPIETAPSTPRQTESHQIRLVLPEIAPKQESDYPVIHEIHPGGRKRWMELHSAKYGFRDSVNDVVDVLHDLIGDDGLNVLINNDTMRGDPCKGKNKELVVEYSIDRGPLITVRKKEHERLRIP